MEVTKFSKAKATLILDHPFFASLLCGLKHIPDPNIPTMGTDGQSIRYNPEWTESLDQDEIVFVLAHEIMHCVLDHVSRLNGRDARRWNHATDYVINQILVEDGVGKMPKIGLLDQDLYQQANGLAERLYDILPETSPSDQPGPGQPGGSLDEVLPNNLDPAQQTQVQADMKVKVIQATNIAKMHGKLTANTRRFVSEITTNKVPWREVLRNFFTKAKIEPSYAKPKRRFLAEDIYLPSLVGETLGPIVVAVDCSGSIREKELNEFIAEINILREDLRPAKIELIYFDADVCGHETYLADEVIKPELHGGGGTDFTPVFEFIKTLSIQPEAIVFLTDLCCNSFGIEPEYPVLWVSTEYTEAPFGNVVKI